MNGPYLQALAGGGLIGLAAAAYLVLLGRVAGVSGALGAALAFKPVDGLRSLAFLFGIFCGPFVYVMAFGGFPAVRIDASAPVLILAGLLVGFGARLGSGCTSGHGVCGLARLSPRSIAAVATFMATSIATVALMNMAGVR